MTTIVWDGQILAADTQVTMCSTKNERMSKIHHHCTYQRQWRIQGESILVFGLAGHASAIHEILDKISQGEGITYSTTFSKPLDFQILAVDSEGRAIIVNKDEDQEHVKISSPRAVATAGSGWVIAETALALGFDAIKAVETAIKIDLYTGGEVEWYKI